MPNPHPALKKLDYFVGRWKTHGTIHPGSWGPGGKFSWTESTKWMPGGFFLIGRWKFKMPATLGGDGEEIFIIGYDAARRFYTFNAFSSQGLHQVSRGTFADRSWTWTSEGAQSGRAAEQKFTMKIYSRDRYAVKFEIKAKRGWTAFMEGKAVRIKS
jgi:hypothetical protein